MTSSDDLRPGASPDPHPDSDTLAVLALGETMSEQISAHVAGCARCQGEIESLMPAVRLGRSLRDEQVRPIRPPAVVWERIAAETGLAAGAGSSTSTALSGTAEPQATATSTATVRPLRRQRPVAWLMAAAAVGAIVGGLATWGWQGRDDGGDGADVVASASLEPLPTKSGTGSAEIERVGNGRELSVRVKATEPRDDFLEVWLISKDAKRLVSLGVLQDDSGSFPVPAGIDLDDYNIVDVSIEPYDGDPAHSHDSLVRGTLRSS